MAFPAHRSRAPYKSYNKESACSNHDSLAGNVPRNRHRDSTTMRHVMNTLVTVELPTNIRRMPAHDQPERAHSLGQSGRHEMPTA